MRIEGWGLRHYSDEELLKESVLNSMHDTARFCHNNGLPEEAADVRRLINRFRERWGMESLNSSELAP